MSPDREGSSVRSLSYTEVEWEERKSLAGLDFRNPRIDKIAVEEAVTEFLNLSGAAARPLGWFADVKSARAYRYMHELHRAYWPLGAASELSALDVAWPAGVAGWFETTWSRAPFLAGLFYL